MLWIATVACGPSAAGSGVDATSTGQAAPMVSSSASSGASATSDGTTSSGSGSGTDSSSGDGPPPRSECDLFDQDCPDGYKCTSYANDGGTVPTATGCFEVASDPAGVGEACTVQHSPLSGVDNCDASSMCWYVDANLQGTCTAFCSGSAIDPECVAGSTCTVSASSAVIVCVPACDPLGDACVQGQTCIPINDGFACQLDTSRPGTGHGTPCEWAGDCPVGTVCIGGDAHTECAGVECCANYCDVTATEDPCPDLDPGQSCEPWFIPSMAPAGYEHVGVCALPA